VFSRCRSCRSTRDRQGWKRRNACMRCTTSRVLAPLRQQRRSAGCRRRPGDTRAPPPPRRYLHTPSGFRGRRAGPARPKVPRSAQARGEVTGDVASPACRALPRPRTDQHMPDLLARTPSGARWGARPGKVTGRPVRDAAARGQDNQHASRAHNAGKAITACDPAGGFALRPPSDVAQHRKPRLRNFALTGASALQTAA
jgi:hypothetical protein